MDEVCHLCLPWLFCMTVSALKAESHLLPCVSVSCSFLAWLGLWLHICWRNKFKWNGSYIQHLKKNSLVPASSVLTCVHRNCYPFLVKRFVFARYVFRVLYLSLGFVLWLSLKPSHAHAKFLQTQFSTISFLTFKLFHMATEICEVFFPPDNVRNTLSRINSTCNYSGGEMWNQVRIIILI